MANTNPRTKTQIVLTVDTTVAHLLRLQHPTGTLSAWANDLFKATLEHEDIKPRQSDKIKEEILKEQRSTQATLSALAAELSIAIEQEAAQAKIDKIEAEAAERAWLEYNPMRYPHRAKEQEQWMPKQGTKPIWDDIIKPDHPKEQDEDKEHGNDA